MLATGTPVRPISRNKPSIDFLFENSILMETAAKAHKDYLDGGSFKCNNSPTGAHYWLVTRHDMVCKFCHVKRKVENSLVVSKTSKAHAKNN